MSLVPDYKIDTGLSLPLMESFYTIQGEGYHQGKAAYFIRLAGCDVGCHWCDVKDSWDADKYPLEEARAIAEKAAAYPGRIAVITGGEPLMYNLTPLTQSLKLRNFKNHIETSGAYPLSGAWDWICLSPKKFKEPVPEIIPVADELKIIIYNKSDFTFAEQYALKVSSTCKLFLQPEWSNEKKMLPQIIEYVKENSRWQISLQVHKYMNIP
jgi:organic radical activating enzyme